MNIRRILIALSIFIFSINLLAEDVNDIIENVQETYEDMDYLSATFKQIQTFRLTGSVSETVGKIYVAHGEKYRFESENQVIATDGKTVWAFNRNTNQLLIDNVRENSSILLPRDLLFKYPKKYFATLVKTEENNGAKMYVIKMDPKEDVYGYVKSMKIWVEDDTWLIRKIETIDLRNNSSTFEITDMDTKTKLSDKLFSIYADENVEVIDRRQN
ncbi:MAG TPA: outer membrane lipoprotein carrier protein LolA [Caldithrix abyssi]|uniref:Outer membrane lipoprotein carrier protein LolA n=1 Tax=Caldithrix abyssi TaxID=187145 RepID=A0A7V4TZQ7_CALAY|nr:outer membrane lipoprotein carrier protein LolA [Caldithrix abyssi]